MSATIVLTTALALQPPAQDGTTRGYAGPVQVAVDTSASELEIVAPDVEHAPPRVEETPAPAVTPTTPPVVVGEQNWVVGGFIDTGYAFDHNLPDNHVRRGNFTAVRANEVTVNLAAIYVRHTPTDAEPWLFELAGQVGAAAAGLLATEPRPGGDASNFTGPEVWQHLARANVGVRVPKVGTELALGLFTTPIGIYSFWSKDNWTFSTPWHLNGVPYVLMGGRVSQPIGEKFVAQAWIVNGWQTYGDINRVPSVMVGGAYTPHRHLTLSQWTYFGAEDVDNRPRAWRALFDQWIVYDNGTWALSGVFDVGRERLTAIFGEPVALWLGGAITARGRVYTAPRGRVSWDMYGRGEAFWDRDGRMFGVRQLMGAGAYGNTVTLFDHVMLRVEYRYDRSTNRAGYFYKGSAVHDDDVGLGRDQHSVFFALTGYFEHAFATRRAKK